MNDPFDETLMDQNRMPVMVVGGIAAGNVLILPQKASKVTLSRGSGFKPMASPRAEPEVDAENVQQYVIHKIEWLGDDGISKVIGIAAVEDLPLPDALQVIFNGYRLALMEPADPPPKPH